ncbi:MAG TPA: hypothetical protein VGJ14_19525 [Sporichthyaceae bacterium]
MLTEPAATRRALHGIGEQVLAGPQHRRSATIRLRVNAEGIATVAEPAVALTATRLIGPSGDAALIGASCLELAAAVGVDGGAPQGLYKDVTDVDPEETLSVDAGVAADLLGALWRGEQALRRLAPGETPVLWPEHFDLGIALSEVNYGISPGDSYLDEPYVYVGPWAPRTGAFFNAPFGAARPLRELSDDALDEFLAEGRRLSAT